MKQKPGGLSLERFAKAKQSGYDKKAKKAKELALNAKKVNKYRKLKQKLATQGILSPRYTYEQQKGRAELLNAQARRPRAEDAAMERIHARAGPAPDSEPEMGEDEMIGEESDSDSGNAAAEQRDRPPVSKPEAAQQKRQRLTPRGDSSHSRKGDSIHASRSAGGGETAAPQRHQSKMSSAGQDSAKRDRGGSDRAETDLEHDSEHEHEEKHSADEPLGRKQKRGKKKKPASQLQRVQAEVQSKKEAEQREREERRSRIEEHACKVAEAERRRKQHTKMLRKRTHQGQPVMRYRMDKILGQLQAEAAQT